MICGIVDLGSNTIRLSIYMTENGAIKQLLNKKVTVGLSGYVAGGALLPKGIAKACSVLNNFKNILENFSIENYYVFATASFRNISNTEAAVRRIKDNTGIDIDVLSGEEEARLDFVGATHAVNISEGLMVDIGGGSTEFVAFKNREIINAASIPIGCLNLYLKHVSSILPTPGNIRKIRKDILSELKTGGFFEIESKSIICGVGGSVRATRKLYNEVFDLHADNMTMEPAKLDRLIYYYEEDNSFIYSKILQISPDRIHTIIPGMIVLHTIAKGCMCEKITVSGFGVREGYLFDKVLRS